MENVNTEEKVTVESKTSIFGKLKNAVASPRTQRTIAATVGAGIGVAATATSSRASKTSIAVTVGFGLMEVITTNRKESLDEEYDSSLKTLAVIAGVKAAETSLVGFIANRVMGSKPTEENKEQPAEVVQTVQQNQEPEQPRASLFEAAKEIFRPKQPEVQPVVQQPAVQPEVVEQPQTVTE